MEKKNIAAGFVAAGAAAIAALLLKKRKVISPPAQPANPQGLQVQPQPSCLAPLIDEPEEKQDKEKVREVRLVKPFLPGESVVLASHMYDKNAPKIEIRVSNDDLQYSLQPKYFPSSKPGEPPIIYLDAQEPGFFARKPEKPLATCWILIKNTRWTNGGYVKRRLAEEMRRQNIECKLIHPMKCDLLVSKDGLENIVYAGEKTPLPDCVIPRVGAVVDYFGLAIIRQLESLGVLMFNPIQSIEISRDKLYTHQVMATNGIPIPKTVLGRKPIEYEFIKSHFGYPVIVKLTSGSKGEAVWKMDSEQELRALMKTLEDSNVPIVFQEFLAASKGRDIRCVVVGGKLVASMMRIAKSGFKANVHQGGQVKNITVKKRLENLAIKVSQLCKLDFSGVDLLMDKPGYKLCEVNSSPGFEGLERATGVDVAKAMVNHVRESVLKKRQEGGRRPLDPLDQVPLQEDHMHDLELRTPNLAPQNRDPSQVPAFAVNIANPGSANPLSPTHTQASGNPSAYGLGLTPSLSTPTTASAAATGTPHGNTGSSGSIPASAINTDLESPPSSVSR